ncbi:DUF1990 family protein [Saccharothrix syringae]|uniref:DUF1990 family protein n=1 Tax=Saccharothrix syringae TaxID=103733 RepID=UPI00068D4428|nr:DUF1990 family protein [Saccharothrix syringae]
MRLSRPGQVDVGAVLRGLRGRGLNYSRSEVAPPAWTFDVHRRSLGREAAGPPEEGGLWWRARAVVADYGFTPPELVRAYYERGSDLLGRDILLEARLPGLRFLMGVRVTAVRDESDADRTLWGWGYETLEGHLERGRVDYELVKDHRSGEVEFVARSYSQLHPRAPWWMRFGWRLVGRRAQLRFYRRAGQRLAHRQSVVEVPSGGSRRFGMALLDPVIG